MSERPCGGTPLSLVPPQWDKTTDPSSNSLGFFGQPVGEFPEGRLPHYPTPYTEPCKLQASPNPKLAYTPTTLVELWNTACYNTERTKNLLQH